jgi:glyoxylase-like metal-dependent hydrolase (beta-lactamase superfamily II)
MAIRFLSRRGAAIAAPTALALGLPALLRARPAAAQGAAAPPPASSAQAPGFYRFKLGTFTVTTLHDGARTMPVQGFVRNAPLEEVQRELAASFLPGDQYRNIYTATLVDTGRALVLFDTGNGPQQGPSPVGLMRANMAAAGIDPARVTVIVLSHFHGDHVNGLLDAEGGRAFPNAELVVPEAEWRFWTDTGNETRTPERQRPNFANAARRFAPYQGRIRQIGDGAEVVLGIRAVSAFGHTPGHTVFRIADGSAQMTYLADTTHRPEMNGRRPDFHIIFDFDPVAAEATRRRLLDQVAADRMRVTGFHYPFPSNGYIVKEGQGYRFVPGEWSAEV